MVRNMPSPRVLVTGANGHLGRGLIARIHQREPEQVRALVRSQRAADQVAAAAPIDVRTVDYTSEEALAEAARGCQAAVHFVGIIKQTQDARYETAHEAACQSLVSAATAAGLERIVYLSILGSRPDSTNACLASKGRGEAILLAGPVPACVLRVPMVLGRGDYASFSLRKQATSGTLAMLGGGRTLQQPIDADDVISAVLAALRRKQPMRGALDLAGPECLSHRQLVERAGVLHANQPRVIPVPLSLARAGVSILERLASNPPLTVAMLDVLQHDDRVDTAPACKQLDLALTPLDETLQKCLGPETDSR